MTIINLMQIFISYKNLRKLAISQFPCLPCSYRANRKTLKSMDFKVFPVPRNLLSGDFWNRRKIEVNSLSGNLILYFTSKF